MEKWQMMLMGFLRFFGCPGRVIGPCTCWCRSDPCALPPGRVSPVFPVLWNNSSGPAMFLWDEDAAGTCQHAVQSLNMCRHFSFIHYYYYYLFRYLLTKHKPFLYVIKEWSIYQSLFSLYIFLFICKFCWQFHSGICLFNFTAWIFSLFEAVHL